MRQKHQNAFCCWQAYWFRSASLFNLAVCRVIIVAFQLIYLVTNDYLGKLLTRSELPDSLYNPLPILQFLWPFGDYRPAPESLIVIYLLAIITGAAALLGTKTNLSLIAFAVSNILIQSYLYSFGDFHHPEALMLIALCILSLSPAGGVLSWDDLKRRLQISTTRRRWKDFNIVRQKSPWSGWPLLLIQWLLALVYLSAATSQLLQMQPLMLTFDWVNGYTLQFYLLQNGIRWGSSIGIWLGQHYTIAWTISAVAIVFESTFFFVLLFPKLAWIYVPVGIVLHAGIALTQRAAFQYLALYAVFIPWSSLVELGGCYYRTKSSPEVFYEGLCPRCIRSMIALRYFDWFDRIAYSNLETHWYKLSRKQPKISLTDCRQVMHVLLPHGDVRKGFFAWRELVKYLPLLWPLRLIGCFPLASVIGPRIYRWAALRRPQVERCCNNICSNDSNK